MYYPCWKEISICINAHNTQVESEYILLFIWTLSFVQCISTIAMKLHKIIMYNTSEIEKVEGKKRRKHLQV